MSKADAVISKSSKEIVKSIEKELTKIVYKTHNSVCEYILRMAENLYADSVYDYYKGYAPTMYKRHGVRPHTKDGVNLYRAVNFSLKKQGSIYTYLSLDFNPDALEPYKGVTQEYVFSRMYSGYRGGPTYASSLPNSGRWSVKKYPIFGEYFDGTPEQLFEIFKTRASEYYEDCIKNEVLKYFNT